MTTYMQQRVWRWIVICAGSAAIAALVRVMGRRGRSSALPRASRSPDETATQAALEIAGGAMSDEGAPVRNV